MLKKTLIATAAIAATLWAAATVLPALAQPRGTVTTPSAAPGTHASSGLALPEPRSQRVNERSNERVNERVNDPHGDRAEDLDDDSDD